MTLRFSNAGKKHANCRKSMKEFFLQLGRGFSKQKIDAMAAGNDCYCNGIECYHGVKRGNAIKLFRKAIKIYEEEMRRNPNDKKLAELRQNCAEAYNYLGRAYFNGERRGDIDRAIKCYDEALRIDPDNERMLNNRANALKEKEDEENARKDRE